MATVKQPRRHPVHPNQKRVMFLPHILLQQHRREDRHKCQGKDQGPQQGEAQRIGQRTEHLPFDLLEREDRNQCRDDDQLGKEHSFRPVFRRMPDNPHLAHHVKGRHPHLTSFPVECDKQPLHHHDRPVDNDAEVYRPHREQIRTHPHRPEADEGKEQRQRYDDRHHDRRTPVRHKNQHNESHQQDSLYQVASHRMHRQVHQILPVIEGDDPHILRQRVLLDIGDLVFQGGDHFTGVFPFPHHDDSLYHVVLFHPSDLSETGQRGLVHVCQVLHQDRRTVDVLHHDILDLLHVVDQTDPPDDIRLRTPGDHVAPYVDIALGNGVIELECRHPVVDQLVRIHTHLEGLHLPSEADDIRHSGDRPQFPFDHPILKSLQLPCRPLVTAQRIPENLPRRPVQRLYLRCHPFRQVCIVQEVIDLLAGIEIVHIVIKHHMDDRQPEQCRTPDIRLLLYRVHGYLDRDRDELLDLLRAPSRPLGNDRHLRVRHIRKSVDGRMQETDRPGDNGYHGQEKDEKLVPERESDDSVYKGMHLVSYFKAL